MPLLMQKMNIWGPLHKTGIKLLPEKNSGCFNQSFVPMVKSMVNFMLTWVSDFTWAFLWQKFYAMGPRCVNLHS